MDEYKRRKNSRHHLELQWDEIDRQLRMEPDISHKLTSKGELDNAKAWMPEMELPLQSQALETLVADSRAMKFPDSGPWFSPHVALTDDYLDKVDLQSLITGDTNDVPSIINQDNVDKMVAGVLNYWMRQYDFYGHSDKIDAEAFKYGTGVGRTRLVTKSVFRTTAKGVVDENIEIPVLFPMPLRKTYLDDRDFSVLNEGFMVGSSTIFERSIHIEDLKMAAKGSSDPDNKDGGWMPIRNLDGDKDGLVKLIEYEGDLIIPRKTSGSIFLPNVIVTIVDGHRGNSSFQDIIRFRFMSTPYSSYILFPYHSENLETPYSTGPLVKGWPVQKAAVDILNRLIEAAALNSQPPISYDKDDQFFAQGGGPSIFPGVQWGTTGDIKAHQIGDPSALFSIYIGLLQQYADVTGVTASRLGARTLSHTTAFAKDAEINRGTARTVDYVRSTLKGPLAQWLNVAWDIGRKSFKKADIYIDQYNGFVSLSKKHLPEMVTFDVHGSGGPQEEQARKAARLQSLQFAMQMDQINIQAGGQPEIDIASAIHEVLREGQWVDIDVITRTNQPAEGTQVQSPVEGDTQGNPGATVTALQALQNAGVQ